PEQVRGEPADPRTDVWAFGCLLYEMLSGRRVFGGESSAEVVASVLRDDVDWSPLPEDTPPALLRLLRRCLQRDVQQRLVAIGDARLELADLERHPPEVVPGAAPPRRRAGPPWGGAPLAVLLAALAAAWIARGREPGPSPAVARFGLELGEGLAVADDFASPFALSPDGTRLVVLATRG